MLVSLGMQAQNYDYARLYFDEHEQNETNEGLNFAALAMPGVKWLQANDDIRDDRVRLQLHDDGGDTVRFKMTESFITANNVENDIVEHSTAGTPPTINSYGPFQYEFLNQELQGSGTRRYRLQVNRLPRRWSLRFQYKAAGDLDGEWRNYNGNPPAAIQHVPTWSFEYSRIDRYYSWSSDRAAMRIQVLDLSGNVRQTTRVYEFEQ